MTLKGGHRRRPKVATSQKVATFGFPVQLASFFLKAANGLWGALQRWPISKRWPPLDGHLQTSVWRTTVTSADCDTMGFLQSSAWHRARRQALTDVGYCCQRCGRAVTGSRESQVHHRRPRDQAPTLLVEPQNLEVLCRRCHRTAHNRGEELAPSAAMACTMDGFPTSADHPWNKPGGGLKIISFSTPQRPGSNSCD